MRRRLAILLAAALAASTFAVLAPTRPAVADTDACAGTGTAIVGAPGLLYPGVGNSVTTTGTTTNSTVQLARKLPFSFAFHSPPQGTCSFKAGLFATGLVSGWCGHSWGTGVTDNGHRFAWVQAGPSWVITGELDGLIQAVPDVLAGESCATGALGFVIAGAVELRHCAASKTKSETLTPDIPDELALNVHVTTNNDQHMWHKACV